VNIQQLTKKNVVVPFGWGL